MKKTLPSIDGLIYTIRGDRVMLDSDLARIYGVSVKRLNEQVRRNQERFPEDFAFRLTGPESDSLRSQFAALKAGRGQHSKYRPIAFTEHGAVMLSAVLRTPIAVAASINVVRAFNRLRQLANTHKDLAEALKNLEKRLQDHGTRLDDHAENIKELFALVYRIMEPLPEPRKRIGFNP